MRLALDLYHCGLWWLSRYRCCDVVVGSACPRDEGVVVVGEVPGCGPTKMETPRSRRHHGTPMAPIAASIAAFSTTASPRNIIASRRDPRPLSQESTRIAPTENQRRPFHRYTPHICQHAMSSERPMVVDDYPSTRKPSPIGDNFLEKTRDREPGRPADHPCLDHGMATHEESEAVFDLRPGLD